MKNETIQEFGLTPNQILIADKILSKMREAIHLSRQEKTKMFLVFSDKSGNVAIVDATTLRDRPIKKADIDALRPEGGYVPIVTFCHDELTDILCGDTPEEPNERLVAAVVARGLTEPLVYML